MIDRKFKILAINPCKGNIYTEENALLLCAKDKAVVPALKAYHKACGELGCQQSHLRSIELLIERVEKFQTTVESRVPDTNLDCEIKRCIEGINL